MNAKDLLQGAAKTLQARGVEYDRAGGERSMKHAVAIFNMITRQRLTEAEGWTFMLSLKLARIQSKKNHADSHVDLAAYAALLGECNTNDAPDQAFTAGVGKEVEE